MLSGLSSLNWLTLNDNVIQSIQAGSFQDLRSLNELSIKGNKLTTLDQCIFNVSNHPMMNLEILMHYNDWMCGPQLCWLLDAFGTWMTLMDSGTPAKCFSPASLAGQEVGTLSAHDLRCLPPGEYFL